MAIYKIGRAEGNHIVLGDKSVSRQHAELEELGAGRFRLKDLGSSSGTQMLSGADWVDVQEAEVRHDTCIRFGEYETTPMDLVRDLDKTVVQAKASPAAAPKPPAPKPPAPKPAPPALPKAAAPAAPRPAPPSPPRPAAPRPAAAGAPMNPKTMWWLLGGGIALLVIVALAAVLVLTLSGEQQTASVTQPPARTETPTAPRTEPQPTVPRTQPPAPPPAQPRATGTGLQKFTQACRSAWGGTEAACQCIAGVVQRYLQEGDYEVAIEIFALAIQNKRDEMTRRAQQLMQEKGRQLVQRIDEAMKAVGRDCKNVQ